MKFVNAILLVTVLSLHLASAAVPQEQPEVIKKVNPVYPRIYLLAGIEGEVYVHVTIDENGRVEKAEVDNATDKAFGSAAVDAIRLWQFKSATLEGKPIRAEVTIPVKFKISDATLPPGELVTLREQITTFLRKGSSPEMIASIDTGTFVVAGGRYESLLDLLKDRTQTGLLARTGQQVLFYSLRTDAAEDAAYMIVKTKAGTSERYHTIVLMKGSTGSWKIVSWHVSP